MSDIPWKYRMETACPVFPDRGCTPDGWCGWIRIERWRASIVGNTISEEYEHVELTPKELADACGAPVYVIQTLMESTRWQLVQLRAMCKTGEKAIAASRA